MVLTDQGIEFVGEFQTLLNQQDITHIATSRENPQADGSEFEKEFENMFGGSELGTSMG